MRTVVALFGLVAVALLALSISGTRVDAPVRAVGTAAEEATPSEIEMYDFPEAREREVATVSPAPAPAPVVAEVAIPAPAVKQEPQATRIENPYPFPPFSEDALNAAVRAALVNIVCTVEATQQSVTGSGVVIDARGVILTNAHVGQYVLLSEAASGIECRGRAGAPARAQWKLRVAYFPETWVDEHAKDLREALPTGTGEHDYALLLAEPLAVDSARAPFSALPADTREGVIFERDAVLLGSYPAGFIGTFLVQNNLYPATTFSAIRKLYTFHEQTIDLLSLGGVIVAQGGSSGGGVVNAWGRLVGLIVTTSDGETTAERDLRAITLAHVDRSMRGHVGMSLAQFLDSDFEAHTNDFRTTKLFTLAEKLVAEIPRQ